MPLLLSPCQRLACHAGFPPNVQVLVVDGEENVRQKLEGLSYEGECPWEPCGRCSPASAGRQIGPSWAHATALGPREA